MYRDSSFPDNYSFGKRVVHRWFRLFPLVFLLSAVFWGMESPANKAVAWATLAGVSNFLPSMVTDLRSNLADVALLWLES